MRYALFVSVALSMLPFVGCGSDAADGPRSGSSSSGTGGGAGGASEGGGAGEGGGGASSSSSVGGGGGEGGAGGGMCPSLGDACTACLSTTCEDLYCTCYGNPQCGALITCLDPCSPDDESCLQECLTAHRTGISDAFLLSDCGARGCATPCPGSEAATACEVCLFTSCADDMNRCLANSECSALIQCIADCTSGDDACSQRCALQHAAGIADAQEVGDCSSASCGAQCP
jgi:hypothetical protein